MGCEFRVKVGWSEGHFFCSPRCSCDCTTFYRSVFSSVRDSSGREIKKLQVNWLFDLPVLWVDMRNW